MRATAHRRSGTVGALLVALLLPALALPATSHAAETSKRILVLSPLQWGANAGAVPQPALRQTATDLARIMGGLSFGLSPREVNERLPNPIAGLAWTALPTAPEFPQEVRYFWMPLQGAGALRGDATACVGAPSYIVFLFRTSGLFRVSYRFLADQACPDTANAAAEVFARFTPLSVRVALSVHYRTGRAEVVDVTDPSAGLLFLSQRWQARAQ